MRLTRHLFILAVLTALAAGHGLLAAESEGYLRTPDIHGDSVAFVAEADLWLAPVAGGQARRLTTHVGGEFFPRFSPDGRWIAFSGMYDGNVDVFVVAASGGEPRRLTWHPSGDAVIGWTPDGNGIVFSSNREHPHGSQELFTVPAVGGDVAKLPLGWATYIGMDADSGRWAFTRTRGGGTWKRYRGGTARQIWVGHPERADFEQVTEFEGMNAFPMWHDGRIYYLSDAGGTANIWSMNPDGTGLTQHTKISTWDARFPAMGPEGRIVFMLAGDIHVFDPDSGKEQKIDIDLPSDRVLTRSRYPNAGQYMSFMDLSPDGDRVAVTTRGEIFSVPVKEGVTLPVTRGSGARESWAAFDPKGKRLVYVTDASHEEEIHTIDSWGRGESTTIKGNGKSGWHYPPSYSPDGKWIAYADNRHDLYIVAADGGHPVRVDHSDQNEIYDYSWSPDGHWLAYIKTARSDYRSIYVYDVEQDETHQVTDDLTDDRNPVWDPEGKYLYFLSDRHTNPLLGSRDMQNINIKPTQIFAALLREEVDNPFAKSAGLPPEDEEEEGDEEEGDAEDDSESDGESDGEKSESKDEKKADADKDEEDLTPVKIDFEGLGERVVQLPVEPGNYGGLGAVKGKVFYISMPMIGMADWGPLFGPSQPQSSLMMFELESKKSKSFMEGISGYSLAAKGEKMAVMKQRGEVYVVGTAAPPGDLSEAKVNMDGLVVEVDPLSEWAQIFYEGWRHMRDYYWDPGLGNVDWDAVRDQYASLLPRLAEHSDLQDLMAEMIGELSTSHTYVFGGDAGKNVPTTPTGLLGADLAREGDFFRVERIYRGAPADNETAPLLEPGVGVAEGDYILAVNQQPFAGDRPFHAQLEGLAGKPVLLTVNDKPDMEGAREVVVEPLGGDRGVRYADWVRVNREMVAEKTGGRIGYVHIPNMMGEGMIEFNTWFYPQLDKEGMVVDVRWNGGGFVSQMIVERFRRPLVSFDRSRGGGISTYPSRTLNGPFVVLTNENAGSDGDIFPAAVQLEGLAPVIGMRSWGGVVGISSIRPMVDNGLLTQPETAWWDTKTGWELENRGVEPDIEVQNLPQELARGRDTQLLAGISEVMRLHDERPPVRPEFGPVRPRDRGAYRSELATIKQQQKERERRLAAAEDAAGDDDATGTAVQSASRKKSGRNKP